MRHLNNRLAIISGGIAITTILALVAIGSSYASTTDFLSVDIDMNRTSSKWSGAYYEWNGLGTVKGVFNGHISWFEKGFLVGKDTFNGVVKGRIWNGEYNSSYQIGTLNNPYLWKPAPYAYSYLGEYYLKGRLYVNGSYVCVVEGYADGDWDISHIRGLSCI